MNKKELLIAQKAYMSRQIKNETLSRSPTRASSRRIGGNNQLPEINSPGVGLGSDFLSKSTTSLFSPTNTDRLPQFDNSVAQRAQTAAAATRPSKASGEDMGEQYNTLLEEISHRTMTPGALVRKVQSTISKDLKTKAETLNDDENRYMPKVSLLRPDGSSLTDIYTSKREDVWAKIMKAQLAEEEEQKAKDRAAKLKAHEEFGILLKKQVDDARARHAAAQNIDKQYANTEPETTKKMAEAQRKRDEEAVRSRKEFISHALVDAALCRQKREMLMRQEIEDSQVMVMKAKQMIAEEEQKKELKKQKEAERLARLAKENVENMIRRQAERKVAIDVEKKAVFQAQQMSIQAEERRRDEVEKIGNRVQMGPVFKMAQELVQARRQQEEVMYKTIVSAENCLNRQLQTSEKAAHDRANADTAYLAEDWSRQINIHQKMHKDDMERIEKIGEVMKQTIKQMEQEDEATRRKKRAAHLKYQHDLDAQLTDLRQRSIRSLKETMTPTEMQYNSNLIKKTIRYKQ